MTSLEALHNQTLINLASLSFVYVLLPVCLLVCYLAPKRARAAVLLACSAGFYFLAQPESLLLCVAAVVVNYLFVSAAVMLAAPRANVKPAPLASDISRVSELPLAESTGRNVSGGSPPLRRMLMLLCVAANIAALGYFSIAAQIAGTAPPLGLLVICVSGIDAVLEAYREKEPQMRSFIRFSLYLMFFPRLYAGPLANPKEFYASCGNAEYDTETVLIGFGRFAAGLLKYAAIGRSLFFLYGTIRGIPDAETSVLSAWLLIFAFAFALYFTFSGLADIARGIAGMLGVKLPQNFYYPYQSRSVTDFFERFNMTVTAFLKRTVLAPLSPAPEKSDSVADCINILLVGMLWGLWFGIRVSCFLWGIFIAVFLILEKYLYPRVLAVTPTLFRRFYTFFAVLLSLAMFAGDSFAESLNHWARMFGAGGIALYNGRILYILSMNWVLLLIVAVFSTNLVSLLISAARKAFPKLSLASFAAMDVFALVLFTALTLGGGAL